MKKLALVVCLLTLSGMATASWYWPFGSDEKDDKPQRLSEMMEPASAMIDDAADLAAEGKVQEAVARYRQALAELDRVEAENPDRIKTAQFATLRNKRAYVNAAIDSMLLSQVRENAKIVAVSDTTALEKKLADERAKKKDDGKKPDGSGDEAGESRPQKDKDATEPSRPQKGNGTTVTPLPQNATKRERAIVAIAASDFKTAGTIIESMLREKPNGALALNLKAAMEMKEGKLKDAEATLDRAIMSNPRSPHAYYNMAALVLMRDPTNVSAARRYYETGRAMGGEADQRFEEALK